MITLRDQSRALAVRDQTRALFYKINLKRQSRDCESLRMILSVPGRVPAPVVGVNDAFLRQ